MVRYTGRQKTITGAVNRNQVGLKMSGCPSRVGRSGKNIRLLGRRVNCMYGLCGPTMVNGAPWRTSGRNEPPYCRQRSTACAQAAGGVGHINSPYTRTRVPAAGKQGCTQVSTTAATSSTLPSEFTITLGIFGGSSGVDPEQYIGYYNGPTVHPNEGTVITSGGSMSPVSTALKLLQVGGADGGIGLFIEKSEGWEEGSSVEVTVNASGAITTTLATLLVPDSSEPICAVVPFLGEVCRYVMCVLGGNAVYCPDLPSSWKVDDTIRLKLLPNVNYNIGDLTLKVAGQPVSPPEDLIPAMGYSALTGGYLYPQAPSDLHPTNLRGVWYATLSWPGYPGPLAVSTDSAVFTIILDSTPPPGFSKLQVQLGGADEKVLLDVMNADSTIINRPWGDGVKIIWQTVHLDTGQEWLSMGDYKLTFLA